MAGERVLRQAGHPEPAARQLQRGPRLIVEEA
jgi:hypothetical protein